MLLLRFYHWVNSNIPIYSKQKKELEGFEIEYFRISSILSKFITSRHSSSFKTLIQDLWTWFATLVIGGRLMSGRKSTSETAPRWINFKETVHVSFWSIWRESSLSWKLWFYSWVLWTVSLKFDSTGFWFPTGHQPSAHAFGGRPRTGVTYIRVFGVINSLNRKILDRFLHMCPTTSRQVS